MDIDIRQIREEEVRDWLTLMVAVFGEDAKDDEIDLFGARAELDRSIAAYDGDVMVGTTGAFSYQMTVPGGAQVPTAGVTGVTVLPTHRRRMVLTRMMRNQIDDVARRGEPFASLWASESGIYGRFGYGLSIEGAELEIQRHHTSFRSDAPEGGRVRLVDADEARRLIPGIYAAAVDGIPGSIERTEADWNLYFFDPEHWRNGASSRRYGIYERDGVESGYITYRQKPTWAGNTPDHQLNVGDLQAVDSTAYAVLHRFAFGIDLVSRTKMHTRRVEEPLLDLMVDRRRVQRQMADKIWTRIVDVPAALSARRYATAGRLVIRVDDGFGPWADGTFVLEGGPDGARCEPTDEDPDLTLPVSDLSAAYLGDSRIAQAAWLGRIKGDDEAVVLAHRMFSWHVEPWCTVHF